MNYKTKDQRSQLYHDSNNYFTSVPLPGASIAHMVGYIYTILLANLVWALLYAAPLISHNAPLPLFRVLQLLNLKLCPQNLLMHKLEPLFEYYTCDVI